MLGAVLLLAGIPGYGQAGSLLSQVTFNTDCGFLSGVGSGVGVGITFDGTNLWYSCYNSKNSSDPNHIDLHKADPKTGAVIASYDVAGGMGALAYDPTRNVIWAGEGGGVASNVGVVIKIPLDSNKNVSGPYQVAFPVSQAYQSPSSPQDIVDGLAIDTNTDTLYIHYDFATQIAMYSASTGAFLGFISEAPGIQSGTPVMQNPPTSSCVVSGLAIGGNTLFEAADYCDYVWAVDKSTQAVQTSSSFSIASSVSSSFDEKALTCDTSTFSGNDAIWVKGAFSPMQAYAFEIPANSCGVGGQPAAAPSASLSPSSLTFASQAVGTTSAAKTVTLSNTGSSSVTISGIAIAGTNAGDFAQTNNCGSSLAAGSLCTINVTFKPTATGTRTATLSVTDNASNSPQTASLTGTGSAPSASLSPSSLTFASQAVGTTSAAKTVTLSNSGSAALSISSIAIAGTNAGDFAQTNNCGSSLAAGSSCTINVTFKPTATGTRTATLSVTDNASNSPQRASLTGTGTSSSPTVSVSPTSLSFGNQQVNTISAAKPVTLSNTGSGSVTISSIAITGGNSTDFAQTNNCGSSLAAGSSCTINVTFKPTATGTRTATLSVTDNASNSPQTVSLTGSGVSPTLTVSVSPTSLSFGNQQVNSISAAKPVTLSNTGSGSVTISSIAIAGGNSTDFAQTNNCGSSLAAGSSCTINVTFKPTATGTRTATLSVTDNASNSPQTVSLSGNGTAPTVSVSPTSLNFGSQLPLTTSAPQTVTVMNSGFGPVTINSISISGSYAGDYSQTNNCGSSLAAGSQCTISVTFTPSLVLTNETATLNISDNATGSPQTVSLSGSGGL